MSKLADHLRTIRVFNNYEMLKRFGARGDVAIEYRNPAHRSCEARKTTVWSPHKHPKLDSPRRGRSEDCKEFLGKRSASFQLAINWAMGEFGHDYSPSPFGGYLPNHVLHKARQDATRIVSCNPA